VFVGKVLSVTTLYHPGSKLSGPTPYHEVKFQTEKSWKLVDREEVTIVTENTIPNTCGSFTSGETYLVYADRLNDILYVAARSRTNRLADVADDLRVLGEPQLPVHPGEFRTYRLLVYGILVSVAVVLFIGLFLYRLNKKPLRPV
jgi:hypothetical protein